MAIKTIKEWMEKYGTEQMQNKHEKEMESTSVEQVKFKRDFHTKTRDFHRQK